MARSTTSIAPWADEVVEGPRPVSIEELERLSDDSCCYELVEGWLVKLSPGGGGHGSLSLDLAAELHRYVKSHQFGLILGAETGFTLSPRGSARPTVLAPDIAFVRADRVPATDSAEWDQYWRLAPDLVVEIASASQTRSDLSAKARLWIGHGVRLVWVVWPHTRDVEVWYGNAEGPTRTLRPGDVLDGLDVIPGFTYVVSELFV